MKDLQLIKDVVGDEYYTQLTTIVEELNDTFNKKQIFRTDTEARISVLNDGNFPTPASKYWQSVREQNAMLENLIAMSFDFRRNELEIKRNQRKLENSIDEFDKEEIHINLDECLYKRTNIELVAKDRIRELLMWSQIKNELNDGTFDTKNVNTHQAVSLKLALENRANSLTPGSNPAEVLNVIGPLSTLNRLILNKEENIKLSSFSENKQTNLKSIK